MKERDKNDENVIKKTVESVISLIAVNALFLTPLAFFLLPLSLSLSLTFFPPIVLFPLHLRYPPHLALSVFSLPPSTETLSLRPPPQFRRSSSRSTSRRRPSAS